MMEFILSRTTVISLAIIGGVFSMLATWCLTTGKASEQTVWWMNKAAYACMGISIILFIGAGLFGTD